MKNVMMVLLAVVISSVTGMVTGCAGNGGAVEPPQKVTLGISATSLLPALVQIADEKGYFLDEGIDVTIKGYPTGKAALSATLNGEVDMSTVADTPIVLSSFERNDFSVFATIVDSAQHVKILALKGSRIDTPQDLIGKKVATTTGTTAHFFMAVYFTLHNMSLSDVEIIDLKPDEMVEAIVAGDVDAICTWEPNILRAQQRLEDNAVILASEVGYEATFNLASMNDFIEANPETIKGILRALLKAETFVGNNRDEAIEILASRLDVDSKEIEAMWDSYRFKLSLSQVLLVTLEDQARWAIGANLTDRAAIPNYLDYIHPDILEAVAPGTVSIIH